MAKAKKEVEEIEVNETENKKTKGQKSNNLLEMLIKNIDNKFVSTVSKSRYFNKTGEDIITTDIPLINVALDGHLDGGLHSGTTIIAGESRRYKTLFGILMVAAFLKKYPDGVVLLFDSELGSNRRYYEMYGINMDNIIWIPVNTVEQLTQEVSKQFDFLKKQDNTDNKVFILVDSLGQLASKKEIDDNLSKNDRVDMTRPKKIKSFFRITTLDAVLLDICMVVINHTYQSQDFIPREIVGGGTGGVLASNTIWTIGKKQIKDGDEKAGNEFIIKLEKSRFCKEGSKIPISVYFDRGLSKFSGFSSLALEFGIVEECRIGRSKGLKFEDKEILEKDNDINEEFWEYVLANSDLKEKIEAKYLL